MKRPPETLQVIPNNTSLSESTKIILKNYSTYHEVKEQLKSLQDWYLEQALILDNK